MSWRTKRPEPPASPLGWARLALPEYQTELRAVRPRASIDALALTLEQAGVCERQSARTRILRSVGERVARYGHPTRVLRVLRGHVDHRTMLWGCVQLFLLFGPAVPEAEPFVHGLVQCATQWFAGELATIDLSIEFKARLIFGTDSPAWCRTYNGRLLVNAAGRLRALLVNTAWSERVSHAMGLFVKDVLRATAGTTLSPYRLLNTAIAEGLAMMPEARVRARGERKEPAVRGLRPGPRDVVFASPDAMGFSRPRAAVGGGAR